MNKKTIGLDLGTSNVRIWTREDGIILREPCVISIDKESGKVDKIGEDAKKLLGKSSHYSNETLCPMRNGVIAEVDETVKLISPLEDEVEFIYNISSTPLICCSKGAATVSAITSGLAPG